MAVPLELDQVLKMTLSRRDEAARRFDAGRAEVSRVLLAKGESRDRVDRLLETFEQTWFPGFSDGNADPRNSSRRTYDAALRDRIGAEVFASYVSSLKDFRAQTATAHRIEEQLYTVGGSRAVTRAAGEYDRLSGLRKEIVAAAKKMNPGVDIKVLHALAGTDEEAAAGQFDPVRRTAAVSLDLVSGRPGHRPGTYIERFFNPASSRNPRQQAYAVLWESVEGLFGEREREILAAAADNILRDKGVAYEGKGYNADARHKALIAAFADFMAPAGRQKPEKLLARSFKPLRNFFTRVANVARSRGFQTAEDVYRRAAGGRIARRGENEKGIRAAAKGQGHDAAKEAISGLTDTELVEFLEVQHKTVMEARRARAGILRRLVPKKAGILAVAGDKTTAEEERRLRELLRGRVLLEAEQRRRARENLDAAAASLNLPPDDPTPPPPPPSPNLGPFARAAVRHMAANAAVNDNTPLPGALGSYAMTGLGEGENKFHVLSVTPPGGAPIPLGSFRTRTGMAVYTEAMDQTFTAGAPSPEATALAAAAAAAGREGSADIAAIRRSGLLDERLDSLVGAKDILCLAYPLKTGEIIWQADDTWCAGTFNEFAEKATASRDRHLQVAAAVVGDEHRHRRSKVWLDVPLADEGRAAAAGAAWDEQVGRYYAPGKEVSTRTMEWRPDLAAAAGPGPARPVREVEKAVDRVDSLSDDDLLGAHKAAAGRSQALKAAIKSAGATERGPMAREVLGLKNVLTAMGAEMKCRGLTAKKAKKKTAGHERGQER